MIEVGLQLVFSGVLAKSSASNHITIGANDSGSRSTEIVVSIGHQRWFLLHHFERPGRMWFFSPASKDQFLSQPTVE